jgi:23S rRNA (adenine2503-C2)-methyltransferase
MKILREVGNDEIAKVYIADMSGHMIEFVESIQPPLLREQKWVLVISCLFGCPVKCLMCDAGQSFSGKMSKEQMLHQIDWMIRRRYPSGIVPVEKFKIQFTRMGEPAFNMEVLDVLEELPVRYKAPGLIPSVSTVGPKNSTRFLRRLTDIKNSLYSQGKFQMQFSVHTTDEEKREKLIPIQKLSFDQMNKFGRDFFVEGDRKITLNFIVMKEYEVDPVVIGERFDPDKFVVKLTPLNPTGTAVENNLMTKLDPYDAGSVETLVSALEEKGFDTIVSIGELEENQIGSNCGQYVSAGKGLSLLD